MAIRAFSRRSIQAGKTSPKSWGGSVRSEAIMPNFRPPISAVVALCLTSACVSAPRPYTPTLQVAATDKTAFESAFRLCADEVAAGKRSNFRSSRAANVTGVVVVVGGTQMVVGGASAISLGDAPKL